MSLPRHALRLLVAAFAAAAPAFAATSTWTGLGIDDNWSTAANWFGDIAPASDVLTALHFAGSTRLTPNTDSPWTLGSIAFESGASAFTLGGSALTLADGGTVTNNSTTTQTIANSGIVLSGASTWDTATGDLAVSSALSGTGSLTKTGAGTLTLTGASTFSGPATIKSGTLILATGGSINAVTPGDLVVGEADGDNGTLQISGGTLATHDSTIGNAPGAHGAISMSSGTWTNSGTVFIGLSPAYQPGDSGTLTISGGTFTNTGAIYLLRGSASFSGGAVNVGSDLAVDNGASFTASGSTITGGGIGIHSGGPFTTTGTISGGAVNVNYLNTSGYPGATLNVTGGTITTVAGSSNWQGGTINLTGGTWNSGSITMSVFDPSGANVTTTLNIGTGTTAGTFTADSGGITGAGTINFNHNQGGYTFSPAIGGTISVNHIGTGTTFLTGTNTYTGGTTVSAGLLAVTTASLPGNVTVGADGIVEFVNSTPGTYAGIVSGDGLLSKSNTGTVTLTGTNTHTGGTVLWGGTLQLGNSGTVLPDNGAVTVNGGTLALGTANETIGSLGGTGGTIDLAAHNLTVNQSANRTFAGTIQGGNGVFVKTGTAALTLTGTLTSTGTGDYPYGATVRAGSLVVNGGSVSLPTSDFIVGSQSGDDATLQIQGGSTVSTRYGFIANESSSTGLVQVSDGTWTNGELAVGFGGDGTLEISGTGAVTVDYGDVGLLEDSTGAVTVSGGMLTVSNQLLVGEYGNGTLELTGGHVTADSVILGSNSGTGAMSLGGGTLTTGQVSRGDGTGTVAFTGGTLRLSGNQASLFNGFADGNVTLGTGGGTIDTQAFNVATALGLQGTGGLTKIGSGTLTLTGASTYAGATTIRAGSLAVNGGSISHSASALTVGSQSGDNATLTLTSGQVTANSVTLGAVSGATGAVNLGGGTLTTGQVSKGDGTGTVAFTGGTLRLSGNQASLFNGFADGNVTLGSGGGTIDTQAFNVATALGLQGAGGLRKSGSGTLTLSGNNTYTGGTTLSAGTLAFSANDRLPAAGAVTINAGTLDLGAFDQTVGAVTVYGGSITGTGTLTGSSYEIDDGSVSANLGGSGALTAGSDATLSGNNTYSGGTILSAGILSLGSAGALGSSGTISFDSGTLQFSAANTTDYSARFSTSAGQNYSIDTNGQNITFATALTSSGAYLTKFGAGTLTLSGNNTYSGDAFVFAGTLAVSGGTLISTIHVVQSGAEAAVFQIDGGTVTSSSVNIGVEANGSAIVNGGTWTTTTSNFNFGSSYLANGTLTINGGAVNTVAARFGIDHETIGEVTVNGGTWTNTGLIRLGQFTGNFSGTIGSGLMTINGGVVSTGTIELTPLALAVAPSILTLAGVSGNRGVLETQSISNVGNYSRIIFDGGVLRASTDTSSFIDSPNQGVTLNAGGGFIDTNGHSIGIPQATILAGAGGLTKQGAGTLTLNATNTYTGGTTLSAGTLALGGSSALPSTGTLSGSGGTLRITGSNFSTSVPVALASETYTTIDTNGFDATFTGAVTSSNGGLVKNGAGNLALDNAGNTITSFYIDGGNVSQATASSLTSYEIGVGSGAGHTGSYTMSAGSLIMAAGTPPHIVGGQASNLRIGDFGGTGTFTQTGGTVTVNGSLNVGNQGGHGTYDLSAGTLTLQSSGQSALGRTADSSPSSGGSTGALNLSGTGVLNITDTAKLVLSNWYPSSGITVGNGTLTQTGGTLAVANTAQLILTGFGTGTYNLNGGTLQIGGTSLQGVYFGESGTYHFNLGGGTIQVTGSDLSTDVAATLTTATTSTINTNGLNATFTGVLDGAGALSKTGGGTLTLSGANAYSGGTTVSAGTLVGTTSSLQGAIVNNAAVTFDQSTSGTYAGAMSGTGSLTKLGAGTLTLTSANAYVGGTTINVGTLALGANNVFANAGAVAVNGGTLDLASFNDTVGPVTLTSGNITGTTGTLTASSYAVQSGSISAKLAGAATLTKSTAGTVTLSGANTRSGGTAINAGTLALGSAGALGSSGTISFGGGTLQFGASNTTDYSPRFSTAASQLYNIDTNSQSVTLASALTSSGGSLTKSGLGTLILSGANTYTGGTTVTAGTLQLGNGGSLSWSGNVTLANGAALAINSSSNLNNQSNVISGTGSVIQAGTGLLKLTGSNTYNGLTAIRSGILEVLSLGNVSGSPAASSLGSPTTAANGTIALGFGTSTGTLSYFGAPATTNRTIDLAGTTGGGVLDMTATDTAGVTFTGNITSSGVGAKTLTLAGTSNPNTISGTISGAATSVVTAGSSQWVLTGNNTFGGGITLNGDLHFNSAAALGLGATLDFDGGALVYAGTNTTDISLRTVTFNTGNSIIDIGTNNVTYTQAIGNSGAGGFTKQGTGTLTMQGANTYTGATTVFDTVLSVSTLANGGVASGIGAGGTAGSNLVLATGTLRYTGSGASTDRLFSIKFGSGTLDSSGTGALNFTNTGNISNDGAITTLTLAGSNTGDNTIAGNIVEGDNTLGLAKSGAGTWILNGSNSYTGSTTVSNGILRLGPTGSLPSRPVTISGTGAGATAWLDLNDRNATASSLTLGGSAATSSARLTTGTGTLTLGGNVTYNNTGNNLGATLEGKIALGGSTRTFNVGNSTNAPVDVLISAAVSGAGGLTKSGVGTLQLTGANTYTGQTLVTAGTMTVNTLANVNGGASSLGAPASIGNGTIGIGATTVAATLAYTGSGSTTDRILNLAGTTGGATLDASGTGPIAFTSALTASGGGSKTLTLTGTNTGANTIGGAIVNNSGTNKTSVSKTGAGTWVLGGTNTYTGATNITAGTLKVSGSLASGSAVTVAGGTLGGSGTVSGTVAINSGGTISPGNSPGTMATGAESWAGGGSYVWEINKADGTKGADPGWDWLNITGTLDIAATTGSKFTISINTLTLSDVAGNATGFTYGQTYHWIIATASGGVTNFSSDKFLIDTSAFFNQHAANAGGFTITNPGNDLVLNLTYVPEPGTWAVAAALFLLILARRRRKV